MPELNPASKPPAPKSQVSAPIANINRSAAIEPAANRGGDISELMANEPIIRKLIDIFDGELLD